MSELTCPFCGYKADSEYRIMYHLEDLHAEGDSPFMEKKDSSKKLSAMQSLPDILAEQAAMDYIECPITGCGEAILSSELDSHLDMHELEQDSTGVTLPTVARPIEEQEQDVKSLRNLELNKATGEVINSALQDQNPERSSAPSISDHQDNGKAAWRDILHMPASSLKKNDPANSKVGPRRLGKAELGPHANEKQMPIWLRKLLEERDGEIKYATRFDHGGKLKKVKVSENHTYGVLPVLAQLFDQDSCTALVYLCDPCVLHISKLWREGGFCGYRNIQMMSSYIVGMKSQGYPHFNERVPTIFQIQEFIESAWDVGINSQGRVETGGIRGTRKYIGTPEAQAMFVSLDISCHAQALKSKGDQRAHQLLYNAVEEYFKSECVNINGRVRQTALPPLYFQHPGHSMTIVGFERQKDGATNLIVFDPMFRDASGVTKLVDQTFKHKDPSDLLRAYRRGTKYLAKYREFEILKLSPPKYTD